MKKDTQHEAYETLKCVFGPAWWMGADAFVWRIDEKRVIKLCYIPKRSWMNMRMLQREGQGPYARILDMRALGIQGEYIVGIVVQEYIRPTHWAPSGSWTQDQPRESVGASGVFKWRIGSRLWIQLDGGPYNSVNGLWVDLARVVGVEELLTTPRLRLQETTKQGIMPIAT